jgi:hypothetical protein
MPDIAPKDMTDEELIAAIAARDFEREDCDTRVKEAEERELRF